MIMKTTLSRSPRITKKYRVTFPNGKTVDFGQKGSSDFTIHKDPMRMRLYVQRHGGLIPRTTLNDTNPNRVTARMMRVTKSNKEKWGRLNMDTPGFWSRWLLWSQPSIRGAVRILEDKFGADIKVAI
jgi:hypothetical protein